MLRAFVPRAVVAPSLLLVLLMPLEAAGERLPIRAYTTADGLAHNTINRIVRDSRGFLWFATRDGLSRFDGYVFTSYGVEQGLPHGTVTDLLETSRGELWVATLGGLVRFRPEGRPETRTIDAREVAGTPPMFTVIVPADEDPRARAVIALLEGRDGTIWCGTRKGLFRLEDTGSRIQLRPVELGIPTEYPENRYINDLLEDRHGTLWSATPSGLYRRWPDGTFARYAVRDGFPDEHLHDLLQDRQGRLWVASRNAGFFRLDVDGSRAVPAVAEHYDRATGLATSWVSQLRETADGRFWIATNLGLVEFLHGAESDRDRFRVFGRQNGLSHQQLTALGEDTGGNLWLATAASGAMRLSRNGFVAYIGQDGLMSPSDVFEDARGVYVKATVAAGRQDGCDAAGVAGSRTGAQQPVTCYGRFNGQGFDWFAPRAPFGFGWVPEGVTVQAPDGEWWVASGAEVYRFGPSESFASIRTRSPARVYTTRDGLPGAQIFRMFADSRGGIWLSIISPSNGLLHLESKSHTVRDMTKVGGFPAVADELPRAFGEDRAGNIWVGLNTGVARYREGTFQFFGAKDGLSSGHVVGVYTDGAGRLWLASARGGLIHVEDFASDRPRFTAYTTSHGLSGNSIEAMAEDRYGRLYLATGRGIDQLDVDSSRVRHFTSDDGLAPGTVTAAFRDRAGVLWFATHGGLSRFSPAPPETSPPPAVLITTLTIPGGARPMSALGETDVTLEDLRPGENQIQIEFVALGFGPGEHLRYQFRLEGADDDWGPPTRQRSVRYAGLAPGRYRFLVRALNSDGVPSATPAVVTFVVLPPVWQRWWFVSLAALALGAVAWTLHRYRVSRVLELERVRTRIATDLHDDIGANLTRIAILSEVARQDADKRGRQSDVPLSSIAEIARESVGAMADIVWAISPERDTLQEVVRKMRAHAEEVFEARDVYLALDLPVGSPPITMDVNVRRDLYLLFKEAVTNAARHSACTRVSIVFSVVGPTLSLVVADNGRGFVASGKTDGNGLANMQLRARRLGAVLTIDTSPSMGTTVTLTMRVGGRWRAAAPSNR